MLKRIIDFLQNCPLLINREICGDFLGAEPGSISIMRVACDPVISYYADGATRRQFAFEILVREDVYPMEEDGPGTFLEGVTKWLTANVLELDEGQTAQQFEIVRNASLSDRRNSGLCYSTACRLIYYQKGE